MSIVLGGPLNELRNILPKRTTCVKCPENGSTVLNGKDVYCRKCLLHFVSHKFRSTLGKQKIFKSSDKVLLALSGGVSSSALLNLVEDSLENEQKKLKIDPVIVHLIENHQNGVCDEFVENLKSTINHPLHIASFASIFEDSEEKLQNLFKSVKTETARRDLYKRLKVLCLVRIARDLKIPYLMVGDNCSNMSSSILADVAQGRGSQIKDTVSVVDKRWGDVTIIRPLRELQIKELALYNHFKSVKQHLHSETHFGLSSESFSIQSETDDFVVNLQHQFPATVCTLFSTASKLASLNKNEEMKCKLCSSVVDSCKNEDQKKLKHFCYGCQSTLREIEGFPDLLPACLL